MLKGFSRNIKPLELLTDEQVSVIHRGTLDVLETTGLTFDHKETLAFFTDHGCKVDFNKKRVRMPGWLVEDCLRKAPSSFALKARDPKNDMRNGGNVLYFANTVGMGDVDLDTWERRTPTREDNINSLKVLDSLENIHNIGCYTPYMEIEGIPPCMTMAEGMADKLRTSSKVNQEAYQQDSEVFTIKMAQVAGTQLLGTVDPAPPLTYDESACKAMYRWIEAGFPVDIGSGAVMGGTGPATIAGSTILNNAELIGGVVFAQLIEPGAAVQMANFVHPMHMQKGHPVFGAVESALHTAIFAQMFRHYGIPTHNWLGFTSGKKIDFQGGYEKSMNALVTAVSGVNLTEIHGAIYGELVWNPVQAVIDEDVAGWIGRFVEGVKINEETLAVNLIEEVGPIPGFYLNTKHTRKWWRDEQFIPKVADRESYGEWVKTGKKDIITRAKERVAELIADYEPKPLTPEQDREIDAIIGEARSYYKQKGLL
ncbi:MAG: hypothetical protein CL875_03205 [Dehalococcoidales bacterium]|jgi:trimethylamine--corrinoid protein Co-methyltransferase|nr:hypothetical protein [Dehalococcoidales bacterium]|tara:strand:- start:664 stop:2109 length:1446 start_codon:yes stop_codon:yes gene_type:complete